MNLFTHQQKIVDQNPPKHLLCWGTGTGKSLATIELAKKNCGTVLIICPKSLKEKWRRDVELHFPAPSLVTVMTKEEFRKNYTTIPRPDGIIVDEAHFFSGYTHPNKQSQMHKSLFHFVHAHKIAYVWLATATAYMSSPLNIYALARILGYDWSFWKFKEKFFQDRFIGYCRCKPRCNVQFPRRGCSMRRIKVVREGIEDEVAALVREIGSTVKMEDCADVPEQVFETEYFTLNDEQKRIMKDVKEKETNAIVRFTKFHQIENGTLKGNEFEPDIKHIPNDKMERILSICRENKKVAIFCRYNLQVQDLIMALRDEGISADRITGEVDNRDDIVRDAERVDQRVLVINSSCSEGYELPSFGVIVFASLSFSYKDYVQACGRFLRINKLKKNVYLHLVTKDGVDQAVYESIMKKQDFSLAIYGEMGKI